MEAAIRNLIIFTVVMLIVAQIFNMIIKRNQDKDIVDDETVAKQLYQETLEEIKELEDDDQALMIAAQDLNYILVKKMIKKGADVNAIDPKTRNSVLIEVVQKSCHQPQNPEALCNQGLRIARMLVDNGAGIEFTNKENKNAIFYAIQSNNSPMIEMLVELSAGDLNGVMDTAIINQDITMVKALLDLGVNVDSLAKNSQETPLIRTVKYTSPEAYIISEFLIEQGADIFAKDRNGNNALMLLASRVPQAQYFDVQLKVFKKILEQYSLEDLQTANNEGNTVLHIAAKANSISLVSRIDMIELLLARGLDINIANTKTMATPLIIAANNSPDTMINFLLEKDANINHVASNGDNLLSIIAKQDKLDMVINLCSNPRLTIMQTGINPLYQAIIAEKPYTALTLLDCNIDYYWQDTEKNSLLHIAATSNNTDMVLIIPHLLSKGLDINARNQTGVTPLMLANNKTMFNTLVDYGANTKAKDNAGNTLLHWAALHNQPDIVKTAINQGLSVYERNQKGQIPLHMAVLLKQDLAVREKLTNRLDTLKVLLDSGSNINAADDNKDTALTIAIQHAPRQVISVLVDNGADINHLNDSNKTVVAIAEENENFAAKQYICGQTNLVNQDGCI